MNDCCRWLLSPGVGSERRWRVENESVIFRRRRLRWISYLRSAKAAPISIPSAATATAEREKIEHKYVSVKYRHQANTLK